MRALTFLIALPVLAQIPAAVEPCAKMRLHGSSQAAACYENLTRSSDRWVRAEGLWGVRNYIAANDLFRDLVKERDKDPALRVRWGYLYLDHWQEGEAGKLFQEALGIDEKYVPALIGLARVAADGYSVKAIEFAKRALELDPKAYEAQEVLARVALEDNNDAKAREEAQKAVNLSPEALEAMSILATIDWLNDEKDSPWLAKIQKVNPHYGDVYDTAGHYFVINRRYEEGIALYRKALELDPNLQKARAALGLNLMRLGREEEARTQLEASWNAGYQPTESKNTLMLMDKYKDYDTFRTPTTILRLGKKESALLRPYFQEQMDRAIATYEKKYKFKLPGPVQLEVYPNHPDFEVRTMGMPGLGALGVTFNMVVAMDSPNSRVPGQFHWASTMWHEFSHVYVLEMTRSRVPRWFTEGLAVYEETAASPDWGDRLQPEEIEAIRTKKLLPVSDIDRGFIHPSYPQQVVVSYFQAGKICNFIEQRWGADKLLAMIHDFGALKTTPETIELEFKMKPEEFDKQFLAWLDAQTKRTVDGFDEWKKTVRTIAAFAKDKKWDDVIREGVRVRDLYPEYVEAASVYEFLEDAYEAKGEKDQVIAELARYSHAGGRNPATLKHLAQLQAAAGQKAEAAATLERLNLIFPKDEELHKRLGGLYFDLNKAPLAVREYAAVVAMPAIDPAGAHYDLARALKLANRTEEAKEEVLSALEVAPNFKPAQKLLLELNVKQ
ncbi:MAG TPA: tetratricopeptide repeat protein [Bryobacteraceae bacterium]|nr:tetratricopeptide repeat protein [Bryobacteraceae bacterium]